MIPKSWKNVWHRIFNQTVNPCGICNNPHTPDELTHKVNVKCTDGVLVIRICDECASRLESIRKITRGETDDK